MKELEDIIKKFTIDEIIYFEENYDRQFLALKKLYMNIKSEILFLKLVILNSINSFRLSMRGEEFWEIFADFFSKYQDENYFPLFLKKYNKRSIKIKLKRFERVKKWLENVNVFTFSNLKFFIENLSNILLQKKTDKTIVFCAKMLNYAFRIIGVKVFFENEISIPIDYRIGKISKNINFWRDISQKTKIPLIYIDSLVWLTFNLDVKKIKEKELREKIVKLKNFLDKNIS